MKIILPVKQVPESGAVRMDEATGTVIRKDADAVVNKNALADFGGGVNFDPGDAACARTDGAGEKAEAFEIKPMGNAVADECFDAAVGEQDLRAAACRRVVAKGGVDVGFDFFEHNITFYEGCPDAVPG